MNLTELIETLQYSQEASDILLELWYQIDDCSGKLYAEKLDPDTLKRIRVYFGTNEDD